MSHPLFRTPQGVKQAINGLMRDDAAFCGASINSMLNFFWQTAENFQTMSYGTFFREGDVITPGIHEATKALNGMTIVTDCGMVNPLVIEIGDAVMVINHMNIPCFIEKQDEEDKRLATRVYFNPHENLYLAVGIEYKGDIAPGPFSPDAVSRFVRAYPLPTGSMNIFETMLSLLSISIDCPECLHEVYRPVH